MRRGRSRSATQATSQATSAPRRSAQAKPQRRTQTQGASSFAQIIDRSDKESAMNPSTQTAPAPFTGGKLVLATLAVALATFMNVLDSSIANVAIPTISGNLGVSVDEGTWVITLFSAANAIAIPLTGWLTQRVGQIKLFVISILLFVFSSWLCGIAPNLVVLLAARILQGAVAGPLTPLSQ